MTVVSKLAADILKPDVGIFIILYELDLTGLGGSTYRFIQGTSESGGVPVEVEFDGETYYPRAFKIEGIGYKGEGQQPRPTVKIADVDGSINTLCKTYEDMLGGVLTRRRTLKKYLDGESEADPTAEFTPELWNIGRRSGQSGLMFEFELHPFMDMEGKRIPSKVVIKDTCTFIYRNWNGSSFDYDTDFPCPYTTATYYERDGSGGTASTDECSHDIAGCKLRYGTYGPLPIFAFPGVNRFRR